jgi:hypothetical protein
MITHKGFLILVMVLVSGNFFNVHDVCSSQPSAGGKNPMPWLMLLLDEASQPTVYHVDPSGSNTYPYNTWAKAATTIESISESGSIGLSAGDVIYIHGTLASQPTTVFVRDDFGSPIQPGANADKTLEIESIDVNGSVVSFSTAVPELNSTYLSDGEYYIWVLNSFRGNTGVFQVTSQNGDNIAVDSSDLPVGAFVTEHDTDSPWTLKGAIIRPIRILGCSTKDSPSGCITEGPATIPSIAMYIQSDYIYFKNLTLQGGGVPIRISGGDSWGVDFSAFDHVNISDFTASGVIVSGGEKALTAATLGTNLEQINFI